MAYTKDTHDSSCLNCGTHIPEDARYCPSCGQKVELIKLPFTHLVSEFFESIFNVDSGLLPTLKKIWLPGQLTIEFFKGRRKKYIRPIRLLLVSSLLFLTFVGLYTKNSINELDSGEDTWIADESRYKSTLYMQRIHDHYRPQDSLLIDTVYWSFLRFAGNTDKLPQDIQAYKDSASIMELVLDSISLPVLLSKYTIGTDGMKVSEIDAIRLSPDELADKYGVKGWINRLVFKQALKTIKDVSGLVRYMVGSILWMFFLTIPSMALVLYILKGIGRSFYIEHLIFTIHAHSLFFVLITISIIIDHYLGGGLLLSLSFPIYSLWLLIALKRYYKRGWFKNPDKFLST